MLVPDLGPVDNGMDMHAKTVQFLPDEVAAHRKLDFVLTDVLVLCGSKSWYRNLNGLQQRGPYEDIDDRLRAQARN